MIVGKCRGWPASTRLEVQKTEWSWNTGQGQGQLPWLWNPRPSLHLTLWQNSDWGRFVREDVPEPRSNTLSRFQGTTTTKTESDEEISKCLCHLDKKIHIVLQVSPVSAMQWSSCACRGRPWSTSWWCCWLARTLQFFVRPRVGIIKPTICKICTE